MAQVSSNTYLSNEGMLKVDNDSIKINYSLSSNVALGYDGIDVSTSQKEAKYLLSKDNNVAELYSDEIGSMDLIGKIGASDSELKNLVFSYLDEDGNTEIRHNVGIGMSNAIRNTAIRHTIHWNGVGRYAEIVTDNGSAFTNAGDIPDIYLRVRDQNSRGYGAYTVSYNVISVSDNTVLLSESEKTAAQDNTTKA